MEEVLDRIRCVFGKEMEMEMYRGVAGNREEVAVERDLILTGRVFFVSLHICSVVLFVFSSLMMLIYNVKKRRML